MSTGPYELVLVKFPRNNLRGEIAAAIRKLVNEGVIRVIDVMFVTKDKKGDLVVAEMTDLEDEDYKEFDSLVSDTSGLITKKDAEQFATRMNNDSSAGLMLFEDTWAKELSDAVDRAGGEVVVNERIPKSLLTELEKSA